MIKNPFLLTEKTIIITGASSGIGRQCAISCSQMGARVVMIGRNKERLSETLGLLDGKDHLLCPYDVTDFNGLDKLFQDITQETGKISGLVHSAGIEKTIPFNITKSNDFEDLYKTNTIAAFEFAKYASKKKYLNEQGGSFVFISSLVSQCGVIGLTAYSASKSALTGGIKSLALELVHKKVRINTIEAGWISKTGMTDKYQKTESDEALYPLGYGSVEDIANACIYLLSDASKWVTGTNLIVDGGYSAK